MAVPLRCQSIGSRRLLIYPACLFSRSLALVERFNSADCKELIASYPAAHKLSGLQVRMLSYTNHDHSRLDFALRQSKEALKPISIATWRMIGKA